MDTIESLMTAGNACPFHDEDLPVAELTLVNPATLAHPNGFYHRLRHEDPIHYEPALDMYLVSRFDDILAITRDPMTFSVEQGYKEQYAKGFADEFKDILIREGGGFFSDAIMQDPPAHTRVRNLMNSAFSAHRVQSLEPKIRAVVIDLIEKIADSGKADGVNDFAVPMTIAVICEQLGFSQFDAPKIQKWSSAVTAQIGRMQSREEMLANAREICELQNFLIAHIRDRQAHPKEDMISDLVHAHAEGDENPVLTFEEVVSLVRALLIAGNETTATALGNLLFILGTRPERAQQLYESADDDRLLTRFIEELLRIEPPVRGLSRMTTKDVEVGGKLLPKGAHMLLLFASGNDDEKEFACPRDFDTTRGNLGRHVAFSAGVHRCLGAPLARLEIKIAAYELVKRLKDISLAVPAEQITYVPTIATHSIASLPITFARRT